MAATQVVVEFKPEAGTTLEDLKNHLEVLEALTDVTVTGADEVLVQLGVDYDDEEKPIVVTTWTV